MNDNVLNDYNIWCLCVQKNEDILIDFTHKYCNKCIIYIDLCRSPTKCMKDVCQYCSSINRTI
ncbi:unnamed protein product [Cuscuta epithymum]|uniref:Uncharacterized protein n=1 Tax=Cuscuta epithymum TaxID=186058 RepID=A0AAV0G2F5_9ASTE|nr:unnamed protein product [Cuscuta epithymum]